MSRKLPPLNALRAFEAAARHLSFSRAAEELNVTPAAVSQQVKALEAHAGTLLFRRLTRELRLTDSGQAALGVMGEGFDLLAEGYRRMAEAERSGRLTISVPPSFGAKWLVPRLERFRDRHPEIEIRLDPSTRLSDLARDDVDVAIRYGSGGYPGLHTTKILDENAFPVCSPALLEKMGKPSGPKDLLGWPVLHTVFAPAQDRCLLDWPSWMAAAGVTGQVPRGPEFGHTSLTLQAAIEGHGIALGSEPLTADDLASGRLVNPLSPKVAQSGRFSYWLCCLPDRAGTPKIAAFRNWVAEEAAELEKLLKTQPSAT